MIQHFSLFTEYDIYLFKAGRHYRLFEKLGAHFAESGGVHGVFFAVWAPNAKSVNLIGDFNHWDRNSLPMYPRLDSSGIWEVFVPHVEHRAHYKYVIKSYQGFTLEKSDPFATLWETPPLTASIVYDISHNWNDNAWMTQRKEKAQHAQPMSVYEVHFGSWRRHTEQGNKSLSYIEAATQLVDYVAELGFTHVEFLPLLEHPYEPSWGYQALGFFAPTSRFGSPHEFMQLVEAFHAKGVGVIMDFVPSHFPMDAHGLYAFDGSHIFEYPDPRKGYHPDWKSAIFDYGRPEVRSFLISSALFWLEKYHIDGFRVDAVASMLYLDYSRQSDQWIPNKYGGNQHLEAIQFLREFNDAMHEFQPDTVCIAEESTAFYGVSKPVNEGGLGFDQKWMMGWMNDTLTYFKRDPLHRSHHQNNITFSISYAFSENFMLPISHDEVVHGKGTVLTRMPGNENARFANVRALYAYMYAHPGNPLLFMGCELAQGGEWNFKQQLDWWLLESPKHKGVQNLIKALNHIKKSYGALYEKAFSAEGFEWIAGDDTQNSVILFKRKGSDNTPSIIIACNFGGNGFGSYGIGVDYNHPWRELLNTDSAEFGGNNHCNIDEIEPKEGSMHGRPYYIDIVLPALSTVYFVEILPKKRAAKKLKMRMSGE